MPGLLMQDPGFFLEKGTTFSSSNALCSQGSSDSGLSSEDGTVLSSFVGICSQDSAASSAVQEDKICTLTSSPVLSDSSEDNSVLRGCGISGILPYKHRCTSSLMRATPSHALSSWAPPSIDVNVNEEDQVFGVQDYESLWPDIAESVKESSSLSGCKNGIVFGNLCNFQKDVAKGTASFSTECLQGRSPSSPTAACLSKYLTSLSDEDWNAELVYASDEFRMYEFKVRRCTRGRSHDWTECPFAHPGEKARRRDPRRFHYSGTACPDFRKGNCKRGDACEFAHGVFECWLHPARYRTQPCKDGRSCMRRICFFAHTPDQLRLVPAASSALKIGGFFDFQSNSPMYQNALLSDQNCSEDFSDENAMFEMLGSTGSFDGSHYLRVRSPHDHHNFCTSPLMASPTSTLACISRSPPSISPPISPSPSPASPHMWNGRFLSPALPITTATRGYPLLPSSRSNFPRVQALLAAAQTDALSFTPPHKSVSSFSLNSTPHDSMSLSFPNYAHSNLRKSFSSAPTSPSGVPSSSRKTLNDLVTAVQQLDLNNVNQIWYPRSTSPHATVPSPLSRTYSSTSYNPSSLSDNCFEDIFEDDSKLQRVESGKALRAEFYGKIAESAKQRDQDESPDLGWVNDLLPE